MLRLRPPRFDTEHTLQDLLHMDHRLELRRDLARLYVLWRYHPRHVVLEAVSATARCFYPTRRNSHALWLSFVCLTLFLLTSFFGQVLAGWGPIREIILPAAAAWLFLFGRVFEIEFAVTLPGIEVTNDTDDDNED